MYPSRQETSNSQESIRIAIVDDQTLVRSGIARLLDDEPGLNVVQHLNSGEQAIESIKNSLENSIDIMLLEARMPGLGSIETARQILEIRPALKIIAMSSVASGVIPSQMLRMGVQGFISKRIDVDEFYKAIRLVNDGQHYVSSEVATKLAVDPFNQQDSLFDKLSRREMQIAQMLTDGKKVSQISGFLDLSPKTVYSYRYRIFEKLGIRSDVELTILAVRHGLTDDTRELTDLSEMRRFAG
mgnify:FL=1|jgi:DNA-binding NarL/FixJ family response regulator